MIKETLRSVIDKHSPSLDSIDIYACETREKSFSGSKIDYREEVSHFYDVKITLRKKGKEIIFTSTIDQIEENLQENLQLLDLAPSVDYVLNGSNATSKIEVDESLPNPQEIFQSLLAKIKEKFTMIETISLSHVKSEVTVLNSFGLDLSISQEYTSINGEIVVVAESEKQNSYKSVSGTHFQEQKFIGELDMLALEKLNPTPLRSGIYDCIFSPDITRYFLQQFFHMISGKTILQGQSNPKIGDEIWSKSIQIEEKMYGKSDYDYEGIKTSDKFFVRNGILEQFALNRKSAYKLGLVPTGNGFFNEEFVHLVLYTTNFQASGDFIVIKEIISPDINLLNGQASISISGNRASTSDSSVKTAFSNSVLSFNFFDLMKRAIPLADTDDDFSIHTPSVFVGGLFVSGQNE